MENQTAPAGQTVVLEPRGRIDNLTSKAMEDQINAILDHRPAALVVDCGAMEFVSSAGLRVLLLMAKRCRKANIRLALHSVSQNVATLLSLGGLASFFPTYPDRAAALAAAR